MRHQKERHRVNFGDFLCITNICMLEFYKIFYKLVLSLQRYIFFVLSDMIMRKYSLEWQLNGNRCTTAVR